MSGNGGAEGKDTDLRGRTTSLAKLLIDGGFWSVLGRFGQAAVMLLGTMLLARLLSPADFGILAISLSLLILVHAALEGLLEYPIVRADNLGDGTLRSLLWTSFALTSCFGMAIFFGASALEQLFRFDGLAEVCRAVALMFPILALAVAGRALMRRHHRFREVARIMLASSVVYVVTSVTLALMGLDHWSLVLGQVTSYVSMGLAFARAGGLPLAPPLRFDFGGLWSVGVYGALARSVAWFWSQIDTLAVSAVSTAASAGLYSRAYGLSTQAKEPFSALDHPVRQALVAIRERGEPVAPHAIMMLRLLTLATAGLAALCFVFRAELILVLLGRQWTDAALPFAILVAGLPARIAVQFIDSVTIASGVVQNVLRRQVLLSLLIGGGVLVVARDGIAAVAAVVALALYSAMLVPTDSQRDPALPARIALIAAMLPGLVVFGSFVALAETVRPAFDSMPELYRLLLGIAYIALAMTLLMALPDRWSPSAWHRAKLKFHLTITSRLTIGRGRE